MRSSFRFPALLLVTFAWFAAILYFGSEPGKKSHARSHALAARIMDKTCQLTDWQLSPKERQRRERTLNYNLRELAHGTEFLIGAALLTLLLRSLMRDKTRAGQAALYLCLFLAALDEIHQFFIPGRSFQFKEIAMDFFGAYWGVFSINRLLPPRPDSRPADNPQNDLR